MNLLKGKELKELRWMLILSGVTFFIALAALIFKLFANSPRVDHALNYVCVMTNIIIILLAIVYSLKYRKRSKIEEQQFEQQKGPHYEANLKLLADFMEEDEKNITRAFNYKKRRTEITLLMVLVIFANGFSIFSNLFL